MAAESGEKETSTHTLEEMAGIIGRARVRREAAERYEQRIMVEAHDEWGLNFRQIGELAEYAHSWVFKLYKKGKEQ